jgi:hypothetical protein
MVQGGRANTEIISKPRPQHESASSINAKSLLLCYRAELQWRVNAACHRKLRKRCKMKTLSPVLLLFFLVGAASTQKPTTPSESRLAKPALYEFFVTAFQSAD